MTETIIGYQFFEEEQATESRSSLVSAKALPKKKGDVTIYWQNYEQAALDKPTFWYMLHDKSMDATMGKASIFKVTIPDEPKEESEEEEPSLPGNGGIKIPPKGKL